MIKVQFHSESIPTYNTVTTTNYSLLLSKKKTRLGRIFGKLVYLAIRTTV